jgi:hypothetical protein
MARWTSTEGGDNGFYIRNDLSRTAVFKPAHDSTQDDIPLACRYPQFAPRKAPTIAVWMLAGIVERGGAFEARCPMESAISQNQQVC